MRRLLWAAIPVFLLGAGAAYAVFGLDTDGSPVESEAPMSATAVIETGDIADTEIWKGMTDYRAAITLKTTASGTVTRVPELGSELRAGDTVVHIDERPVTLMTGAIPMYRDIGPGDEGVDVEQFERGLAALGYEGFTVDDEFTWYTAEVVKRWQGDVGLEETGAVSVGSVIFTLESGRVDRVHSAVGDQVQSGERILDMSGSEVVATFEIDVDDLDTAEVGTAVDVKLADGSEVAGTVADRTVLEESEGASEGEEAESVAEIEVELAEPVSEEHIGAPVQVEVVMELHQDVLLVPVSALLALSEGGFGLELAEDGTIVAVETGLFADGMVEVSGSGLTVGTEVGTTGR